MSDMTALQLLGYIAAAIGLQSLLAVTILIWRRNPTEAVPVIPLASFKMSEAALDGLRAFRVAARSYEDLAHTQCAFALAPVDKTPLPPFKPGQFLAFSLAVDGAEAPARVIECYCLSDIPDPAPMIKAMIPALQGWGIADADIHCESFGPQTLAPRPAAFPAAGPALAIGFCRSGRTLDRAGRHNAAVARRQLRRLPPRCPCRGWGRRLFGQGRP
jgi:hypothetical protein